MGLRDALRRLRGSEEQRVIDAVPWDVGGPLRPASVSVDQALGLVPVFAAVRLLASQVASLPLQTYRKTGDTRQKISPWPLFVHPSVQGTLYDWLHRCMTSLALRGNAFGYITQRDRDQYPTMIEWLHPDDVRVDDRMPSGPGSYTSPVWYWQGRVIPAEDLLHIPWFTVPGRVLGLSPIGACAATISTGISAQVYTSDWFDSGAVPPGEFRNTAKTVTQTEADIISARLNAAIKRRKPLIYGNDWEYKPIAVAAHEAKFIETMRMNATQIASIYGIPPEMIGGEAGGPLTYNTVESNAAGLEKFTLRPWLTLLEAAFFALMPRPQYVKFNVDSLLRTDLQTRMASYQTGRQIGLYNIDEARAIEDLPPLPNGEGQDYTPLQILTGRAAQPATQTRYLPRHAEYVDAEVIDVRRRELRHTPGGHQHNQLSHAGNGVSGMPANVVEIVLKVAGGTLNISAAPGSEGKARLGHDDRSVELDKYDIEKLRRAVIRAQYAEDREVQAVTRVGRLHDADGNRVGGYSTHVLGIRPTGKLQSETGKPLASIAEAPDGEEIYNAEFDLIIGEYPDDSWEEYSARPGVRVTLKDIDTDNRKGLYQHLQNTTAARRVDTGNGPTDVFTPRPGAVGLRMKDDDGNPTEVILNARDFRRIRAATNSVIWGDDDGVGESGLDEREHTESRVVDTSAGPVEVRFRGHRENRGYTGDSSLTITPQYAAAWGVAASGDRIEDFLDALDANADMAGVAQRSHAVDGGQLVAAADLVQLRLRRSDPTDPAAMSVDLPDWDPDEPDPDADDFIDEGYSRAVTPEGIKGGARLKAYWTTGPGLAKWVASPHPWTALYRQLRKYMPARKAKATAASWFHAVKGYWPGHQKGKNPVGPG